MYNQGISYEGDLIDKGVEYKIVRKAGSWLSYGDEKLGQGREASKRLLKEDSKLSKEIEKKIWTAVEVEEQETQ